MPLTTLDFNTEFGSTKDHPLRWTVMCFFFTDGHWGHACWRMLFCKYLGVNFHQNGSRTQYISNLPHVMKLDIRKRRKTLQPKLTAAPLQPPQFPKTMKTLLPGSCTGGLDSWTSHAPFFFPHWKENSDTVYPGHAATVYIKFMNDVLHLLPLSLTQWNL